MIALDPSVVSTILCFRALHTTVGKLYVETLMIVPCTSLGKRKVTRARLLTTMNHGYGYIDTHEICA